MPYDTRKINGSMRINSGAERLNLIPEMNRKMKKTSMLRMKPMNVAIFDARTIM